MLRFACPKLKGLAAMMREKYDARNKMILRNGSDADMLKLEYELVRINRTIARHRRNCFQCKPYPTFAKPVASGQGQTSGEKSFVSFDIAS
jgi:hypothetical protein